MKTIRYISNGRRRCFKYQIYVPAYTSGMASILFRRMFGKTLEVAFLNEEWDERTAKNVSYRLMKYIGQRSTDISAGELKMIIGDCEIMIKEY